MPEKTEEVKVVGKSGQISLGKRFAGKRLKVEHRGDGTILLTSVVVIPESQLWTLEEPHAGRIQRGLSWASKHAARATKLEQLEAEARPGARKRARAR